MLPGLTGIGGLVVSETADFVMVSAPGTQSFTTAGNKVAFSTVERGSASLFDDAADTLTAPATLCRLSAGAQTSDMQFYGRKNTSIFSGSPFLAEGNGGFRSMIGGIVICATTDDFDLYQASLTANPTTLTSAWLAVETIDPTTDYALVYNSANQAISAGVWNTMAWNSEVADTAGAHDNSTNNSRLSVPVGQSLARVTAGLRRSTGAVGDYFIHAVWKNNSSAYSGLGYSNHTSSSGDRYGVVSPVLVVDDGTDYFEIRAFPEGAGTIEGGATSWAQIEFFPAGYKYATIRKSANQAIGAATYTQVTWGAAISDPNGYRSGNTIVAPSDITECRVSFGMVVSNGAVLISAYARINGSALGTLGLPHDSRVGEGSGVLNAIGAWVDCSAGDVIDVMFYTASAQNLLNNDATWLCVEFR